MGHAFAGQALGATAVFADEVVRAGRYPAAVLLVADRVGNVWSHVAPGKQGVAADTIFPVASLTKPIIAVAVMQLVERGCVRLDDSVAPLIPGFEVQGKGAVTLRHLLTHTSGLREDSKALEQLKAARAPIEAHFDLVNAAALRFQPGTRGEYSNIGFYVLANLIARLSGKPYTAYLHERVFIPLGMVDTGFAPTDPARAAPHHATAELLRYQFSLARPSGGLWSTASDLCAFGRAFLSGDPKLLGDEARSAMTRLHTQGIQAVSGKPPPDWRTGLGWFKPDPKRLPSRSERSFGHGGSTGSMLWIDPDRDLVFVFLSNITRTNADLEIPESALDTVYEAI